MEAALASLRGGGSEEQALALSELCERLDSCASHQARSLCACLRDETALHAIVHLLDSLEPHCYRPALLLLGKIASDAVDESASFTRALLTSAAVFPRLIRHVSSDDSTTLVYALRALQNMCIERENAERMREEGVFARLRLLGEHEDPLVQKFAMGCITNMTQTIGELALEMRALSGREENEVCAVEEHARSELGCVFIYKLEWLSLSWWTSSIPLPLPLPSV